MILFIMRSFN